MRATARPPPWSGWSTETRVVELDGQEERVRLRNIVTPETVHPGRPVECMGPEATERMNELVGPGDQLILEFDQERTDRYDRLLAGVYADEVLLNEQMARDGFGAPVLFAEQPVVFFAVLARQPLQSHLVLLRCAGRSRR